MGSLETKSAADLEVTLVCKSFPGFSAVELSPSRSMFLVTSAARVNDNEATDDACCASTSSLELDSFLPADDPKVSVLGSPAEDSPALPIADLVPSSFASDGTLEVSLPERLVSATPSIAVDGSFVVKVLLFREPD